VKSLEPCIECKKLSKSYGQVRALKDVTLNIGYGERVAVLGPNGAGKSTLLKILATQTTSYSGTVKIFGKNPLKDKRSIRSKIGFLGHASFLYDELTVEENLSYYGKMFSIGEGSLRRKMDEIISLLGLERWRAVQARHLSHGLRKRADIARVLLHSPNLLILDEPFSGLDKSSIDLLLELFRSQKDMTILFSSHSVELADRVCTRKLLLEHGQLVKDIGGR
jgi:ABC-type multidrug transport system ATPase subunit